MDKFDVAIIGSGPSAASAHRALMKSSPHAKVCILEAGGEKTWYTGEAAAKASPDFRLSPSIYMGAGGTSELWHYVLAPLDPIDFEKRDALAAPGWPITYSDLKKYYESALVMLGVENEQIFETPKSEFSVDHLDIDGLFENFEPKLYIQLKRRWRAKEYWEQNGIPIHYFHMVRALRPQENGVEVVSFNNNGISNPCIFAKKVIVSAGGLNTPQIIFNTELDGEVRGNIGKTLLDHPMGVGMQIKRSRLYNFDILTSKKEKTLNKKVAFRIKDAVQRSENLPNSSFYFRPSFKAGYSEATEDLKAKILLYRDYIKRKQLPLQMTLELLKEWSLVKQIISYKTGLLSSVSLFDIFCVTEQVSRESKIIFEKHPDGYFSGRCVWRVSKEDEELNRRSLNKFVEWTDASHGAERVTVRPEEVAWIERATSAAHHIGTVPMGQTAKSGAVDKNCSVFGLDNSVFVADASAMPSAGCANVTLTSMAIASRVGEYVGKTL